MSEELERMREEILDEYDENHDLRINLEVGKLVSKYWKCVIISRLKKAAPTAAKQLQ